MLLKPLLEPPSFSLFISHQKVTSIGAYMCHNICHNKELFENAPPYMIFRPFLKGGLHMSSGQISKLIQINYGTNVLIFMCSFWQNYMNIMTNLYHIHLHLSSQIHMDMGTNMNNTSDKYTQRFQQIHRNIMTTLIDTSVKYTWRWQ